MDNKLDFGAAGFFLGIVSMVLAFIAPIAGLVLGIIGLNLSRKSKENTQVGRTLNWMGIVISLIVIIVSIIVAYFALKFNLLNPGLTNVATQ